MKDIKEYIVNEKMGSMNQTWRQVELVLKPALKAIKSGKERTNDTKLYEDWESAINSIGEVIKRAMDVEQAQQIFEYIVKNY